MHILWESNILLEPHDELGTLEHKRFRDDIISAMRSLSNGEEEPWWKVYDEVISKKSLEAQPRAIKELTDEDLLKCGISDASTIAFWLLLPTLMSK